MGEHWDGEYGQTYRIAFIELDLTVCASLWAGILLRPTPREPLVVVDGGGDDFAALGEVAGCASGGV